MQHKADTATGLAYAVSIGGVAVGEWFALNWFQAVSALFVMLTFSTHIFFHLRRDRREAAQSARDSEIHGAVLSRMQVSHDTLQGAHDTLQTSHDTLQTSHDTLQTSHDKLQDRDSGGKTP